MRVSAEDTVRQAMCKGGIMHTFSWYERRLGAVAVKEV